MRGQKCHNVSILIAGYEILGHVAVVVPVKAPILLTFKADKVKTGVALLKTKVIWIRISIPANNILKYTPTYRPLLSLLSYKVL